MNAVMDEVEEKKMKFGGDEGFIYPEGRLAPSSSWNRVWRSSLVEARRLSSCVPAGDVPAERSWRLRKSPGDGGSRQSSGGGRCCVSTRRSRKQPIASCQAWKALCRDHVAIQYVSLLCVYIVSRYYMNQSSRHYAIECPFLKSSWASNARERKKPSMHRCAQRRKSPSVSVYT